LVLAATAWLGLAPAAGSHTVPGAAAVSAKHLKVDPSEVAALGEAHALVHARAREMQRAARVRWLALTPAQRRTRLRTAERAQQRLNRALAVRPRDDIGYWGDVKGDKFALPDSAIHSVLMPTGEILIFGREPIGAQYPNLGSAAIFNPQTGKSRSVDPPPIPENNGLPAGIYCGGMALLSDGRVFIAGGNLSGQGGLAGLKYTFIFNPWTETWEIGPQMSAGRWYPTLVKLSSGDILIMSGLDDSGDGVAKNPQMDLFRPGIDDSAPALIPFPAGYREYNPAAAPDSRYGQSLYPGMFTLPDGNVVLAGPGFRDSAILRTKIAVDRTQPLGSAWKQFSTNPTEHYGGAAALEPHMNKYDGTWDVLLVGGKLGLPGFQPGRKTVERLRADPAGAAPGWQPPDPAEQLNQARYWTNDVLLPDGGLVVVGGGSGMDPNSIVEYYIANPAPQQLRQVELRRPGEKTWRLGAAQQEWRTYHSTALLLPDGRVFSGGDDYHEGPDPYNPLPASVRRDSAELYWPPYLFNGDRCAPRPAIRGVGSTSLPTVASAPAANLTYGERFGVFSEHARAGMQVVLAAPSAVTHSINMNQRIVPVQVTSTVPGGGLNVRTPANASIAPPGWYMLFIIDADGTPSLSRWVRLLPSGQANAERGGKAPATVSGLWPAPNARSCVNPDGTSFSEGPRLTAKLSVSRVAIRRSSRKLDVRAHISKRASGTAKITLVAGKRTRSFKVKVSSAKGQIRMLRRIPVSQAKVGTGIVTITYDGNDDTRPQSVRLRAARRAAKLKMKRPTMTTAGRIRASGTISKRARGVVRIELQYVFGVTTQTVQLRAKIKRGKWKLSKLLPATVRDQIAHRSGTLHSYTLFTGYKRAGIRGEMRSFEVLGGL
jgi:Domain of unknown function (DUF1929)